MAFGYKRGSFNKVSSASGSTNTITTTFQVKALICWSIDSTTNDAYVNTYSQSFGFSDGTTHRCVCEQIVDASNPVNADAGFRDKVITFLSSAAAVRCAASASFGGSTDATVTWDTNDTSTPIIHYIALGDSDITNAKVVEVANPSGTSNFNVTGVGFQGDFIMACGPSFTTAAAPTINIHGGFGIGAATTSTDQRACAHSSEAVTIADTYTMGFTTNKILVTQNGTTGAGHANFGFVGFIADGFTLSHSATQVTNARGAFLVIKGGKYQVGHITGVVAGSPPVDATAVVTNMGGDFEPAGVFFWGCRRTAVATSTAANNCKFSIGAAENSTAETCTTWSDDDGTATATLGAVQRTNRILETLIPAGSHASSTIHHSYSFKQMNSNGFQITAETIEATAHVIGYIAFGPFSVAGNAIERSLATETTSISEAAFTRLAAKTRARTDTAIVIGESRTRLSEKMRPLTAQTVALSENVIRVKGKVKSLATETVTIAGGTLAKLKAAIRTATDTLVISENRARLGSKSRALATQTTVLSDSSARIKSIPRIISQTVTIGENLARLGSKIRALSLQTIVIGETRNRLKAGMRSLATQTTIIGDNLLQDVTRQIIRTLSDTIIISAGSITRAKAAQRIISQTTTVGENIIRLSSKIRALSIQTVGIGESLTRIKSILRTISQSVLLSENMARLSTKLRPLAVQTVTIVDNVIRQIIGGAEEITRSLTETVLLSESASRLKAAQRLAADTVSKAENLARIRGITKTLLQTVLTADATSRIKSTLRTVSQTTAASDSITKQMAKIRTVFQTIIIAENAAQETLGNLVRSLVETITASDSITRQTAKLVILAQNIAIVEQASRLSTKLRIIPAQTTILSDSVIAELNVVTKNVIRVIGQIGSSNRRPADRGS